MAQINDSTSLLVIKLKNFNKGQGPILVLFMLPLLLILRLMPSQQGEFLTILFYVLILIFFLMPVYLILNRNRAVVILSQDNIHFVDPILDFLLFPKWVKAKWADVVKVQTYETMVQKYQFAQPKRKALGGGLWGNEIQLNDLLMFETKIYLKVGEGTKEKALVVSVSNEKYSEYLNYLKTRIDPMKTDSKTKELFDEKILKDEMIKRQIGF